MSGVGAQHNLPTSALAIFTYCRTLRILMVLYDFANRGHRLHVTLNFLFVTLGFVVSAAEACGCAFVRLRAFV